VIAYCEKNDLAFLPWSPLGGWSRYEKVPDVAVLRDLAKSKGVSPYQIVLAWMLAKSPAIIPIPGASRVASIEDSVGSVNVSLTPEDVKKIEQGL